MATKDALAIKRLFLGSSHHAGYAVVGASKDTTKIGSQVLKWYVDRDLNVTPVHPKESELEYIKTLPNIGELPEPTRTPVHVITNPKVTLGILQKAKEIGTPALWLQPGAEDDAVIDFINNNGLADRVVYGGACVLKEGDPVREYLGYRKVAPEPIQVMQRHFLTSKSYAVVGASKERTKYGNRVLRWYQTRDFDVIPVHPKEPELEGIKTINNIGELPNPTTTSIHIITPPKITLAVVQKAKELGSPAIWIQPGAEDDTVIRYVKENGLADRVIYGGPCILVQGDGLREQLKYQTAFNGRPHPNW